MRETAKNSRRKPGMKSLLGGTILTDERVTRQLPFLGLLAFFALVLITNRNWSERTIRQIQEMQETLDELRSESVTLSARLMDASRPSEVVEKVEAANIGLHEPVSPPKKIVIKKNKRKWKLGNR
ncbi:MAG: FtsL-like putative cell division protein [Mariniphaga sp.]|nr:FtsL-like putative cell division protein [Mariniphaga sp.]MDD4225311.1 FtsL-like putative cell division protein [Mariniphaga sp.]MDD4424347.1 FtsL-like putative cell division protein [Mariniphaga sp.]